MLWCIKTGKANRMQKISHHFSIEPNWDINEYKALDYKLDQHKDNEDNQRYINAGHLKESLKLYNYFEPNPMPKSIEYIKSHFTIKKKSVAINLFTPGQYMPIHYDRFTAYKKINNVDDGASICRFMIMLEDSVDGQMLQIGNIIYNTWQAGRVFHWCNKDMHTFYNLSTENRYAVQLTGTYS